MRGGGGRGEDPQEEQPPLPRTPRHKQGEEVSEGGFLDSDNVNWDVDDAEVCLPNFI